MWKHSKEKSGKRVWRTDIQTDGQTDGGRTDRVQTYSPLWFHRWGTKSRTWSVTLHMEASYQLSCRYVKAESRKVRKTNFEQRAITDEKVGQPWRKSNLICNSSYISLLPTFIKICESIAKKSPENECDGQTVRLTDRLTEGRTDRVQTYSPLRFHRWGTNNYDDINHFCQRTGNS